jgi:hypothetical protein
MAVCTMAAPLPGDGLGAATAALVDDAVVFVAACGRVDPDDVVPPPPEQAASATGSAKKRVLKRRVAMVVVCVLRNKS